MGPWECHCTSGCRWHPWACSTRWFLGKRLQGWGSNVPGWVSRRNQGPPVLGCSSKSVMQGCWGFLLHHCPVPLPFLQRRGHVCPPAQTRLSRVTGAVQAGIGDQHLRGGLRHPQALCAREDQHYPGVCTPARPLLTKSGVLQASCCEALTHSWPAWPPVFLVA